MASSLADLREGVADRLRTIPGIQAHAKILANPYLPIAFVVPGDTDYHQAMGNGHSDYNIAVEIHAATFTDIGGQDILDALLSESGDMSVKAALEADPTLGGLAHDLIVQGFRDYGAFARASGEVALGARVLVWVMAAGT